MADNTYGTRLVNTFVVPETYNLNGKPVKSNVGNGKYYLIVNSITGEILVKSPTILGDAAAKINPSDVDTSINLDRTVGRYPRDGSFVPELGKSNNEEIRYFSSVVGQRNTKNQAVITAQKAGAKNASQLIFPNTATSGSGQGQNIPPVSSGDQVGGNPETEDGAPQQGSSPDLPPSINTLSGELANPKQLQIVPGIVKYPKDMRNQDVIQFRAVKLLPRTSQGITISDFSFGELKYEPVDGPVYLSVQSPISDQNSVEWGPDSINSLDAFVFGSSLAIIESQKPEDMANVIREKGTKIYNAAKTSQPRILRSLAGGAAGVNNILARTDNVILNPNLELLFNSPQLRPFTFTFKLSARDKLEAKDVKTIIKYFKYHMAVRKENNNIFLKAPNVFTIQYMTPEIENGRVTYRQQHRGINKISGSDNTKACALTNFSVDYTPLGSYMTYNDFDKTMVSYTINLQFQELTPIYDTDYDQDHPIGY